MSAPGTVETMQEPSAVRFAVIILALLAMILGPISGPTAAHAMNGDVSATATNGIDCDRGSHAEAHEPGVIHDHCKDGRGTCMDASGCRHIGCPTGGPVPSASAHLSPAAAPATPIADADRPDGLDVAPPLDPPRPRA